MCCEQAVLERTLAVHLAVKQSACVEGGFTSAPYTTLFQVGVVVLNLSCTDLIRRACGFSISVSVLFQS